MASVGFGLLRSILVGNGSLSALTENGIDDTYFQGPEKQAYTFICDYFNDYSRLPLSATVSIEIDKENSFDNLPDEPLDFWIGKVKERKRYHLSNTGIASVREKLEANNIEEAVNEFGEVYSSLKNTYTEFRAIDLKQAEREVVEHHNRVQAMRSLPGVPFGFPYLDAISGGAQPGDSSVIVGQTGCGKTTLTLSMGINAWYSGHNVLCLCTEMPVIQVARRLLAMEGGFNSTNLKLGRMSGFGIRRALQIIDSPHLVEGEETGNWFKLLPGGIYSNLEDILLVCKELRPRLLLLDGASLIRVRSRRIDRWERMIHVMETVKNFAMSEENLSTISTYHYNKQQPGTTEGIYGGLAMSQLSSIVMSFEYERKEDRINTNPVQYRLLKLLKGRDGETGTIRVLYNMLRSLITQDRVVQGFTDLQEEEAPDPIDRETDAVI